MVDSNDAFSQWRQGEYPNVKPQPLLGRLPLYPRPAFDADWLSVGDGHHLYVETCGREDGEPVVVLHGGPGGGVHPLMRRYFDPDHWRVILFDQRGAGQSRPHTRLEANNTDALIEDMEKLRKHLGVKKWWLFGGSWGSTLALLYAQRYPEHCLGLMLRGIFLCRPRDVDWLYGPEGAARLHPDHWRELVNGLPQKDTAGILAYYREKLALPDEQALPWAQRWARWEARLSTVLPNEAALEGMDEQALAIARLENHYFCHDGFIRPNQILEDIDRLFDLPGFIVHGRHDRVCPAEPAFSLANAWPQAQFTLVETSAHSSREEGNEQAILASVRAAQELSE